MIIFYSKTCESCSGNRSLSQMNTLCKKHGVEFQTRRTIFWRRFEEEAEEIMAKSGAKIPFFYGTESGVVLEGTSFTPLSDIEKLIEAEKGK